MGIVLGIEAAVGIAEAVEAAAEVSDAIASAAEAGEALTEDPSAIAQAGKLDKLIKVLNESSNLLQELTDWLNEHSRDTTNINDVTDRYNTRSAIKVHPSTWSGCKDSTTPFRSNFPEEPKERACDEWGGRSY